MSQLKCCKCNKKGDKNCETFKSREKLIKHLKTHHGMQLYHCSDCEAHFEDEAIHKRFHEDYPYQCKLCPAVSKKVGVLSAHMEKFHPSYVGLQSPTDGLLFDTNGLPCRGQVLLDMVEAMGIGLEVSSRDFFAYALEGGRPRVAVHAVTPSSAATLNMSDSHAWPKSIMKPDYHVSHLVTDADLRYSNEAIAVSFDPLNWVYLDPKLNSGPLNGLEMFVGRKLSKHWDEIIIVTVVVYENCDDDRIPLRLGKALIMTRNGEDPKLQCFSFPNAPSSHSYLKFRVSLEKFLADMKLPLLFGNFPELEECNEKSEVFKCCWLRCKRSFHTTAERDAHIETCTAKELLMKREIQPQRKYIPCLHCLHASSDFKNFEVHHRVMHVDGRRRPLNGNGNMSTNSTNATKTEGLKFVENFIDETPLSSAEIRALTSRLLNKVPSDVAQ